MPRRPVHLVALSPKPTGRDGIWAAIRKQRLFTPLELHKATDIPKATIRDYLKGLVAAGYVARRENDSLELIRDVGVEAPRVRKDGSPVPQTGNELMWRAMKWLKVFTPADLASHAKNSNVTVAVNTAKAYCQALARARYLAVVNPGCPGKQAVYRAVNVRDALPPQIQRNGQIWDPNLGRVVWPEPEDRS